MVYLVFETVDFRHSLVNVISDLASFSWFGS